MSEYNEQDSKNNISEAVDLAQKAGSAIKEAQDIATAAETGATAGETLATAGVAGSATAGIGAIAVFALSIARTLLNKANEEISSITDGSDASSDMGGLTRLLLLVAIFAVIAYSIMAIPSAVFIKSVNTIETTVSNAVTETKTDVKDLFKNTFFPDDKREFFEEIFDSHSLDITLNNRITMQNSINSDNAIIYKEIINKAIETAFHHRIKEVIYNPEYFVLDIFTDFNREATLETYLAQPYPYNLKKANGDYYTVGDYIDGNIPEEELNNDLNYAEVIAVMCQKEGLSYNNFNYSEFYDMLFTSEAENLLYEAEFGNLEYYYTNDAGEKVIGSKEYLEAEIELLKQKKEQEKADRKISETTPATTTNEPSYKIESFYNIIVYPYGLEELYAIAETDPLEFHHTFQTMHNYQMLNDDERWIRATVKDVAFGPAFYDRRNESSPIYNKMVELSTEEPTGRSLMNYTENSITKNIIALGSIPQWDLPNRPTVNIDYSPTGNSVVLEMYGYINQGDYKSDLRGTGPDTIAVSGCCDCSYTMTAQYYHREELSIRGVSKQYVNGNLFRTADFLQDCGMTHKQENYSETSIVNYLTQGTPVILHISGRWEYNGKIYHKSQNGHFLVIMGYDDEGFYVYDPGSRSNTNGGAIPYEAFLHVNGKYIRPVFTTDTSFIPYYMVNTISNS